MADVKATRVRDYLTTLQREAMKIWRVYDGQNRISIQYECQADTKAGNPCMRTDYKYDGTTARILGLRESVSTWDATWDFTV